MEVRAEEGKGGVTEFVKMRWLGRSGGMLGGQEWMKCRFVERVDGWRRGSGAVVAGKGSWSVEGGME